jgi:ribosomal protein S18 acetylase RimI-like enzyme
MLLQAFTWFHKNKRNSWLWKSLQPTSLVSNSKSQDILVATDKTGKMIGYIASSSASYGAAYIPTVGVHPRYQNKGIGTVLLRSKLKQLRRQGMRKAWLLVTNINTEAVAFYLKQGFVIEGYLRAHTGPSSDEVLLSKFL